MENDFVSKLERAYKRCSDGLLHPEYSRLLNELYECELTQELVDFLCQKATSQKHFWEIRFEHLKILLLNNSAYNYDLKSFYFECQKKSRRLALKLFYIRGYAYYAGENEMIPIMKRFCSSLEKNHDYIDYEHILSVAGLPYLAKTYGYDCFMQALHKAQAEYQKIDPLLRGYFTIDKNMNHISLLPFEEIKKRQDDVLTKHGLGRKPFR